MTVWFDSAKEIPTTGIFYNFQSFGVWSGAQQVFKVLFFFKQQMKGVADNNAVVDKGNEAFQKNQKIKPVSVRCINSIA